MAFDWNNFILLPQDSSCHIQPGWYCDFHFGYGCDVMEEDALNEKYCIQVLRIGITNADTEIDELERDLVFLQSELAWVKNEEWSDICCNALRKRIDCLYISLRNLKSKDKNNMEDPLSVKPAESLHEIVKALLRDHFQEKIKQRVDNISKNSRRNASKHAVTHSKRKKPLSIFDLKIISEVAKDDSSISTADVLIVDSSLNHMGMSTNMGKNAKLVNTVVQDSGSNACCCETGHCIDMIKPCMSDVGVSENEEVSTCCSTVNGRSKLLISSLNSDQKKNPSKADKGVTLGDATSLGGGRNNSDSKLATSRQAEGGNSNTIPDALRPPSGLSGRRNDSDPGLVTSRLLKVENADGSSAALRHSIDLNLGRNNCDSRLGGFRQENGGNCDINQKLCDFALKIAHKRNIKKSSLADKTDSSCSSSEAEGKKKRSQLIVNTEHSVITSTLELQDGKGTETDTTKTLTEVGAMQPEVEMAETAANDDKFNLDLSVKPQKQKAKRKAESSSLNDQEPVSLSVKTVLNSPSISKAKRWWNAGLGSDSSSSNQSWKGKMKKKFLNGQFEVEE